MRDLCRDSMTREARGKAEAKEDSQVKCSGRPERKDDRSDRTGTKKTWIWKMETKMREVDARLRRVEDMIYDEITSGQAGRAARRRRNEQWQKLRGKWWMWIDQPELCSRQRRKMSRAVRRLISRGANGIKRLIGELRQSIGETRGSAQTTRRTRYCDMSSGESEHVRIHVRDTMRRDDGDLMHYHAFSSKQQAFAECALARALFGTRLVFSGHVAPTSAVRRCVVEFTCRVLSD